MARALAPLRETCRRLACDVLPGAVQAPAQGLVEPLWLIADTEAACPGLFRWVDPPERPLVLGWSAYAGELWADFTLQEQVRQQWEHFRRYRGTLACFNVKEVEGLYGQVEKLREMAVVVLGQLEAMEELSMKGAAWFGCGRCAGRVLVVLRGAVRSLGEAEVKLRADIGVLQDLEVTVHQNGKDNRPLPIDEQTLREASDRAADLAQETGRIMSRLWGWSNVIEDVEHTARELDLKRAEDLKLEMERNTKEMERNRR
ncbi:uncharacterized protein B0H64DRAFT_389048 [Chaetomium fimeti]|uniref:Uncharacterized protein n=1 Tax=Chaetomium fimeti TaxID=1854472 RepID=A0AAE0LVZ3_9PEZI|nr:hypothetical protein B0H64DRAFT_389048 [Chaetomium fimeti]